MLAYNIYSMSRFTERVDEATWSNILKNSENQCKALPSVSFCLMMSYLHLSAALDTADRSRLKRLSSPISKEIPLSPGLLTSMVSPPQPPLLALPFLLTPTWSPFSSLNAPNHGIKQHLCQMLSYQYSGPNLSLELQVHISSCLSAFPTSPQGCL